MPLVDRSRPMCVCGYDLTGLAGPPWTCPECATSTTHWPPLRSPLAMTRSERWFRRISLAAIVGCPVLAPWAGMFAAVFLLLGAVAVPVFVGTLFVWLVRDDRGAAKLVAVLPCLVAAGCAVATEISLFLISAAVFSLVF